MEALISRLVDAAKNGEVLTVIYHGGSQPGTQRQIAPIRIDDKVLWARYMPKNIVKSFSLSKIELIEQGQDSPISTPAAYDPEFKPKPRYIDLKDFLAKHLGDLESAGWYIGIDVQPDSPEVRVGVFKTLKDGTPRKHPIWSLEYRTHRWDEEEQKERQRKWLVNERDRKIQSFMTLDQAADVFLAKVLA